MGTPRPTACYAIAAVLLTAFAASSGAAADPRKDCQSGDIAACTEILRSNPADVSALANRGVGLRVAGEYDRAIADFTAAIKINPGIAGLYLERGLARAAKAEHALAIADFDEAIRRDPSLVQAHFARAMSHEAEGENDRARVDLDTAAGLDQKMVGGLYMQRGYELRRAQQYEKAIAAFDRALAINPGWLLAYFGRGASFEAAGDIARATDDYRKCVALNAGTPLERQRQQEARERLDKLHQ